MKYLSWNEKTITDFSEANVSEMYEKGYVFTRIGRGIMQQTRSVRIDLSGFELTSENRRILKKTDTFTGPELINLPESRYTWEESGYKIGKLAKDFYDSKFEPGIMSAQKVKIMLVEKDQSNFNILLKYWLHGEGIGYVICYSNTRILHYCYPFYSLDEPSKDAGLGMMIRAIQHAKESGLKYIYLGSLQRPSDTYKLQFEGLEWFDEKEWSDDLEKVKEILKEVSTA